MAKDGKQLTNKSSSGLKSLVDNKSQNKRLVIPQEDNGYMFITFSFKYFGQQRFFEIGEQDATWFVSLLDKMKELSGKTRKILENPTERKAYRFHPINWNAKKCPIKIEDIDSLPQNIIENAEEIIFWQFQLSKSTGRVVGFFYDNIFYIVLLDPKHNIQPSKDYGYSVDETKVAITEYERVQMCIARIQKEAPKVCKDKKECLLSKINDEYLHSGVFYACIDSDLKETYMDLIESGEFQEKFENFLISEI
mgnify:CR=1 FL=1